MDIGQGKVFYKADAGIYLGTIVDIVEKPNVQTQYGPKNKVMIVWTLTQIDGRPYLNPEGSPFEATAYVTASITEKSTQPLFRNLFKIVAGVLGGQPPLITSSTQLEQILLGRSNGLMLTKEVNPAKQGDFFVNIVGIMPLAPGQVPPATPQGYVRAKNRPKTQAGPQGQSVQTYQQAPATAGATPATSNNVQF